MMMLFSSDPAPKRQFEKQRSASVRAASNVGVVLSRLQLKYPQLDLASFIRYSRDGFILVLCGQKGAIVLVKTFFYPRVQHCS